MASNKQFKDPIYGYIDIDSELVTSIIDTPAFQRLKDIRQTSYTPLYPGAYHNRYIHSIGVYHLGRIAFNSIKSQLKDREEGTRFSGEIDKLQRVFELACLLHDIGHAPFSHTGETFYLDKKETLYAQLKESVNSKGFSSDFDALGAKKPAPHECMSCVVGLRTFASHFSSEDERNLFARCIIGMPIRFLETAPEFNMEMKAEERREATRLKEEFDNRKKETELLNCIISLLNSSIIDVDRLDYIIRDAATIGFKNVQVDYMRLLNGMRILEYNKGLCIGYHKSALSVIESAVYAHDSEKKWIQSHPSILYEMEALKNAMSTITSVFSTEDDRNPLFCYEALTEKGKTLRVSTPIFSKAALQLKEKDKLWSDMARELENSDDLFDNNLQVDSSSLTVSTEYSISLLADEDFLFLMKQFCKDQLGYEYFARNQRRLAVWKSEAEFRALFQERIGDDSADIRKLEHDFESLITYCQDKTGCPIVNNRIFEILDQEEKETELAKKNNEIPNDDYEDIMLGIKSKRHWSTTLENISKELEIEFEFLIVFQKKFNSSFKSNIGEIPILFPNIQNSVIPLENVINVLKSSADHKSNFFHVFYKPKNIIDEKNKKEVVNTIAKRLISAINE